MTQLPLKELWLDHSFIRMTVHIYIYSDGLSHLQTQTSFIHSHLINTYLVSLPCSGSWEYGREQDRQGRDSQ